MESLRASLNSICRLCLTKVDDPSTMQTLEDEEPDTVWTASVRSFTLKKPMVSDSLPNKMCSYCAVWITKLIHFKLQCQVSERLLTSLLQHYKEQIEKATAVVTVDGQQWNVPMQNTSELLSRYDNHLNRLHKAVQFTVTHLDNCAGNGQPVLPYRAVNTVQFYLTFIQHLLLSVNSVTSSDSQGISRTQMPVMNKEQPWDSNCMPVWAQEILNQSCGQLWDRFIQATCDPLGSKQTNHSGAASDRQQISRPSCNPSVEHAASSEQPLLHSVLSQSRQEQRRQYPPQKSATCSNTLQMASSPSVSAVIHLDDDDDILLENSNVSKSDQRKQTELSASLTSQPQKLITSKSQKVIPGSSKEGGESIHNLQKSAETREKLNDVSEIQSSNILAQQKSQQQASSKASENSVLMRQLTSPLQNTTLSQVVQGNISKTQSNTQQSKSAEVSVPLESSSTKDMETSQSIQIFSEVHELLTPNLVQENLQDQTMQSSTLQDLVGNTQEHQKSINQLTECQAVEHSGSLRTSSAELVKKTRESEKAEQVSRHAMPTKSKTINEKDSSELIKNNSEKRESRETAKETLGSEEVNRVQEQTKKTGSKELTSQATNLHQLSNKIQESHGQVNKTNESQTSEMHLIGSNQSRQLQASANLAAEANKSVQQQIPGTASSSGQEAADVQAHQKSSTKSAEESRLQTNDKQKFFELILKKAISRAYEREKAVPSILKRRKRVRSCEDPISLELQKHIEFRIKSELPKSTNDEVSRPSSAPNAGVFDVLPPLIPISRNSSPSIASNLSHMSKLKERSINHVNGQEIPSSVNKSIDSGTRNENVSAENTVPTSLQSSQPTDNVDISKDLTSQKNSELLEKSSENSAVKNSSPVTLHPTTRNEENRKCNEEKKKGSEEANAAKDPVVINKGVIRVRQDLATDPATRISSHNSKQLQPSNSFAVLQNQANASNLVQPFPVSGDLPFTGSQMESGTAASQLHTSQLRVPVSGNASFTATTPQQTGLPFVQHSHLAPLIPASVSNQHLMHPLMSTSSLQHWMARQPLPYQHGIVGSVPHNQTLSSPSITNVSQALPVGVITTVFPPPPYPQPLPTSQASQIGANNLLTTNAPICTSLMEKGSVAMSRLYQKHLGINVPESEHFKEPYITQLVCQLQSLQNGNHYPQGGTQLYGVPQQKNTAAAFDPKISGRADQQEQRINTSATRTLGSYGAQSRASVPVSQQNMQYNGAVRVSEPQNIIPGQQNQAAIHVPLYPLSSMNRMAVLQQQQAKSKVMNTPITPQQLNPLSQPVQRFQQNPQTLGTAAAVSQQLNVPKINTYLQQPSVITSVVKNPVLPQNTVQVLQHNNVQAEANNKTTTTTTTTTIITTTTTTTTTTAAITTATTATTATATVATAAATTTNNNHPSTSQQALKTRNNLPVLQHQKVQAATGTHAPQQSWNTISIPQYQIGQTGQSAYLSHFKMNPMMSIPTSQNQKMQACSSTSVSQNTTQTNAIISVPGHQKQAKLVTSGSQKVMQSNNVLWPHQKQVIGALVAGQVAQSHKGPPVVCVQKTQSVLPQEVQARNNTSVIQSTNGTAALQPNVAHLTNSTQQHTKNAHTTAVSKSVMLPNQCNAVTSSKTFPQNQLLALSQCVRAAGNSKICAPIVYGPGIVTPNQMLRTYPGASNKGYRQPFLNVGAQCNTTLLKSKQQNSSTLGQLQGSAPSTSAKYTGHPIANMQGPSEYVQRVLFESEVQVNHISDDRKTAGQSSAIDNSYCKKDQPGVSVLPEVLRAIGPELGMFMEEDALESSLYRMAPWKSAMVSVAPEHPFMQANQKSKSSARRTARSRAAFTQSLKLNLISLMSDHSRELLGLSEERWQKLQEAVLNPTIFRSSNWKVIKPPGVKIRRYFKRRKPEEEENKVAVPSVTLKVPHVSEPVPNVTVQQLVDNVRVGDVLQSEVMALFAVPSENTGVADITEKPCDFRIKITKNNGKYESSPVDYGAIKERCTVSDFDSDSSDSWELYVPRAAKRRRVIYDDEDDNDDGHYNGIVDDDDDDDESREDKPQIKVWQLQAYQLAPYVSVTKLNPEFFQPDCLYDLTDLKVAAMAQRLSMVVRKPGTVGMSVKQELQQ